MLIQDYEMRKWLCQPHEIDQDFGLYKTKYWFVASNCPFADRLGWHATKAEVSFAHQTILGEGATAGSIANVHPEAPK